MNLTNLYNCTILQMERPKEIIKANEEAQTNDGIHIMLMC